MPRLSTVELTPAETHALLALVRTRLAEVERMVQNLEEGEGMDLERHNALKLLRGQAEGWQDLAMKLDGVAREQANER